MSDPIFSCIIPASAKDAESQNLKDLIASIKAQDFQQDQIEILVMGEEYGDSEQAKAAGIRQAKGEICAMFCADNYLDDKNTFQAVFNLMDDSKLCGVYSKFYAYHWDDNSLNRYFSLIGCNDPIPFYLNKCDRFSWKHRKKNEIVAEIVNFENQVPSLGDNGFFFRKTCLAIGNTENYYPMDIAEDLRKFGHSMYCRINDSYVWHRTSDNLISFLIKRYKYARDLYSDRQDRRWKMVDTNQDKLRLCWFVISTITILPALAISIKGFLKIRDFAWFWHIGVCWGFLITYTILSIRNLIKHGRLFQVKCLQPAL